MSIPPLSPKVAPSLPQAESSCSLTSRLRTFRYLPKELPKLVLEPSSSSVQNTKSTEVPRSLGTQTILPKPLNFNEMRKRLNSEIGKDLSPCKKGKVDEKVTPCKDVDKLEGNVETVHEMFPLKDKMEIQDALLRADWSVKNAAEKIKLAMNKAGGIIADESKEQRKLDASDKVCQVGPTTASPSPTSVSVRGIRSQLNSANIDDDDDDDVSPCFFSLRRKQRIIKFLSKVSLAELQSVPGFSRKKAESLLKLRPFISWKVMNDKLNENGFQTSTVFENVLETLRLQDEISILMKSCGELSDAMSYKLSHLSEYRQKNHLQLKEQPSSIPSHLKLAEYQMVGLGWLRLLHEQKVNGILADEMGLGKTVQVCAFLAYLRDNNLQRTLHMIVVPSSTLENWSNELRRWCPTINVEIYYGSQEDRKNLRLWWRDRLNADDVRKVHVLLTTYNLVSSTSDDKSFFRKLDIQYIVYDEAHMLKNMNTQRYASLMRINAEHRILLTGTPLQNNLVELMSLLVFVMPQMFAHKQDDLKKLFKASPLTSRDGEINEFEREKINQANKIMKPFILRRLKKDVLMELPPKLNEVVLCSMTELQTQLYKELVEEFKEEEEESTEDVDDEPDGLMGSMGLMMKLRRVANHPALIRHHYNDAIIKTMASKLLKDRTYKEDKLSNIVANLEEMSDHQIHQLCLKHGCIDKYQLNDEYLLNAGKLERLDELLPKLQQDSHRVLIFSQFRQVMDILEDYCTIRNYKYQRLDGQTPVVERQTLIDNFNFDSSVFIFLLSTRAGGFGINLATADTVIIHDIDLNPYNDKQAEDRCHRVGQARPVTVKKLVSQDTIEEVMFRIAQSKLNLEQELTRDSRKNELQLASLLKQELRKSI